MQAIYIVGNSGAARECYWLLRDIMEADCRWKERYFFAGFFSWQNYQGDLKELADLFRGPIEERPISERESFVIGVGSPALRKEIYEYIRERKGNLPNIIHPWSSICSSAILGEGNILQRGGTIYANAEIGNGNYLNGASNISHDVIIGDFNFLAPYAIVLGGAKIGNLNCLGPHAVILPHAVLGNENSLAPGSSLYKGYGDGCRLAGSPALKIGDFNGD